METADTLFVCASVSFFFAQWEEVRKNVVTVETVKPVAGNLRGVNMGTQRILTRDLVEGYGLDEHGRAVLAGFAKIWRGSTIERRCTPTAAEQRREFLSALFRPGDFIDLRAIDRHKHVVQRLVPADCLEHVDSFVEEHPDSNIYFGVASRLSAHSGRLDNCGFVRVLWSDIDFKANPEPESRAVLEAFRIKPNIIIGTGGGLHCYFLLDQPYQVQADAVRLKSVLRRLAHALKADMAATDPARCLRMPASRNFKYDPPREVVLERFHI